MNDYRSKFRSLALAGIAALMLHSAPAFAQHDRDDGHSHGEVAKPKTYAEATRRIGDHVAKIDASLKAGSLAGVSDQANAIAELAKQLGPLALAKDSGVAREKVKDTNLASKELAEAANALHEAADGGDMNGSKAQFAKVQAALAKISADAPGTYYCPMHCEGDKTYSAPGKCPVCEMNLKLQTTEQYSVEVKPLGGKLEAGKPATLLFTLKDPRGAPVKSVEIVHEMPLHLLMVSTDLSWYAHEHPELQPDGTFVFKDWTFPAGGEYILYHDFTPKDVGMQVVPVTLKVSGTPSAPVKLAVDADKPKVVDGYSVTLDTGGPVKTGAATHMAYTITKDGKPVTDLTPYLGAMGHLVIISEDRTEFVHSHPHEEGAEHGAATKGGPKVDFEAHFKKPGLYKGWAQFQHMGKVVTVPFTFQVQTGASTGAHDDHGGGHDHH
jgi:hypothetical protein